MVNGSIQSLTPYLCQFWCKTSARVDADSVSLTRDKDTNIKEFFDDGSVTLKLHLSLMDLQPYNVAGDDDGHFYIKAMAALGSSTCLSILYSCTNKYFIKQNDQMKC